MLVEDSELIKKVSLFPCFFQLSRIFRGKPPLFPSTTIINLWPCSPPPVPVASAGAAAPPPADVQPPHPPRILPSSSAPSPRPLPPMGIPANLPLPESRPSPDERLQAGATPQPPCLLVVVRPGSTGPWRWKPRAEGNASAGVVHILLLFHLAPHILLLLRLLLLPPPLLCLSFSRLSSVVIPSNRAGVSGEER